MGTVYKSLQETGVENTNGTNGTSLQCAVENFHWSKSKTKNGLFWEGADFYGIHVGTFRAAEVQKLQAKIQHQDESGRTGRQDEPEQ